MTLHTTYQHGIFHSDLKPFNCLIINRKLKLNDFFVLRALCNQADMTSIIKDSKVGTVNYRLPEATENISSSRKNEIKIKDKPQSDVWSLECIL